jgi:tRNA nucleotidyltransferase/poly(A) polymerase
MYRYANIIKTIRSIAPQAHLAGGAVRDTILEKEIRDIDMFVDDDHVDEVAKLLRTDFSCVKTGE